jgi:hypothetical protein
MAWVESRFGDERGYQRLCVDVQSVDQQSGNLMF